jgi:hypothetical protein
MSSPEYSPLGVITSHYSGVKYNLNKHTINPTLGWSLHMVPSRLAWRLVDPFDNPRGEELRSLPGAPNLRILPRLALGVVASKVLKSHRFGRLVPSPLSLRQFSN